MVARLSHLSRKVSARRADELLEEFGLSGAGDRVLKTYSGGMRRRLDLAAALVANPPVLFLDEPTTGLDPQSRQGLWVAIEDLVRDGTTVLLTTQYLEEADRLARDIVVIDHGQVIAEGTPAQLKADLGTSVVSVTLGDRERRGPGGRAAHAVLGEAAARRGPRARAHGHATGRRPAPTCSARSTRREITIAGLALREPSLDDVFLSLTGHKTTIEDGEDEAETAKPKRGFGRGRKSDVDRREGCRMTTTTITAPVPVLQPESGQPPVVGRGGHRHHDEAQPPRAHPDARGAVLHDVAAHHVHAAVHLRLRWGHPRPGRPLHRVPDAGHLRADGHLRRHERRRPGWPRTCTRASSSASAPSR